MRGVYYEPLGFLQAEMQQKVSLSLQTNRLLYEHAQDEQSGQGLPHDVIQLQATGHSGKPCSPINCVSQENWPLAVVAPLLVAASGFLSEAKRVSLEDQFSETRIIHFFCSFKNLQSQRAFVLLFSGRGDTLFLIVFLCSIICGAVPCGNASRGPLWICLFTFCHAIFLVIFSDYVTFYQLDITE